MGAGVGHNTGQGGVSHSDRSGGNWPRPYILFNPVAHERTEIALVTVWDDARPCAETPFEQRAFSVVAPNGATAPCQVVDSGNYWGHRFLRLAFPATIPALGYATYVVREGNDGNTAASVGFTGRQHHCSYSGYEREPVGLQNELVRLDIDPREGGIARLTDLRSGLAVVEGGGSLLEFAVERARDMNAWLIEHTGTPLPTRLLSLKPGLKGPYMATVVADFAVGDSRFAVTYGMHAGDPAVRLGIKGRWLEWGSPEKGAPVLTLRLPTTFADGKARYEIPFSAIDREAIDGQEVPALRWAQVCGETDGGSGGLLLANDCKHGHAMRGRELRVTLVRSSFTPDPLPEIGEHEINFALLPFAGEMPVAEAIAVGRRFNHPPRPVATDVHEGSLPGVGRLFDLEGQGVILDAVKKAEKGDALVLRLHNPGDRRRRIAIRPDPQLLGTLEEAAEVDILERPNGAALEHAKGAVDIEMPPFAIKSVRMETSKG
jgi:alpha-mannosidase